MEQKKIGVSVNRAIFYIGKNEYPFKILNLNLKKLFWVIWNPSLKTIWSIIITQWHNFHDNTLKVWLVFEIYEYKYPES
jgi:hypothetical protein